MFYKSNFSNGDTGKCHITSYNSVCQRYREDRHNSVSINADSVKSSFGRKLESDIESTFNRKVPDRLWLLDKERKISWHCLFLRLENTNENWPIFSLLLDSPSKPTIFNLKPKVICNYFKLKHLSKEQKYLKSYEKCKNNFKTYKLNVAFDYEIHDPYEKG